jgi:hypothetical protein
VTTDRLTPRQLDVARALLEGTDGRKGKGPANAWIEFDRGEFRYTKALYGLGFVSMHTEPLTRGQLTFQARLRPEKTEELRRLVAGLPSTPVSVSYELSYLSPLGGGTVREPPVRDREYAFKRRDALNQDPTQAIPNTVEIMEVTRKRIA